MLGTKDAPAILFIKGQLPDKDLSVAIIGTRKPSYSILEITRMAPEYPFGTNPSRHYFVARYKVQAGLSNGVVLIHSTLDGVSFHASKAILEYGR